jgi:hypothetical protein
MDFRCQAARHGTPPGLWFLNTAKSWYFQGFNSQHNSSRSQPKRFRAKQISHDENELYWGWSATIWGDGGALPSSFHNAVIYMISEFTGNLQQTSKTHSTLCNFSLITHKSMLLMPLNTMIIVDENCQRNGSGSLCMQQRKWCTK